MTMTAEILHEPDHGAHVPVMVAEVLRFLDVRPGGLYVDATAGWGGHSLAILESCRTARLIAFDRDPAAVAAARARLALFGARARVVHRSFGGLQEWLAAEGIDRVDGLFADLGVSSPQLDDAGRGMSFRHEGPLDMRMDPSTGETALELVERLSQDELADVIYQLGEERRSRRVARCIKQAIAAGELDSTLDLRRAIVRAVGPRRIGGVDPATRTFQALRIHVNRELEELDELLDSAHRVIRPGGTLVILSFHSLEDRKVKRAMLDRDVWERLTPKPLVASAAEQDENPRSRSAKLRAARRLPPAPTDGTSPESQP